MSDLDPVSSRPVTSTRNQGRPWTIAGFVMAALALFFVPIVLGPLGAIFGGVGYARGDRKLGLWAVAAGFGAMVLGLVLAALLLNAAKS